MRARLLCAGSHEEERRVDDVVCEEDEDDDETLAVVWWMTEQMLGVAAHRGAVGARHTRADVIKIYICVPLHFVATLLHLVVVLVLLAHDVVHSTFLLVRAGAQQSRTHSRTLASSVITLIERLRSGVQRIRAGGQQFPKLCLRRCSAAAEQPVKGAEVEAFTNAGR
eukprot:COSAG06_NODE_23947_length_676_cov_18.894281_1_plen_166_part_10